MKLLVGVPYIESSHDPPCKAAVDALDACGMKVEFHVRTGYGVDMQRNRIAAKALADGFDWLLFVDADVTPPPDALANLLEHDADVCTGWYINRHGKDDRACLYAPASGWQWYRAADLRAKRDTGIHTLPVKGGGLGFCLIRAAVFDALKFPWFEWRDVRFDRNTGDVESCGEDIDFFIKLERAGIQAYADTRVECAHG